MELGFLFSPRALMRPNLHFVVLDTYERSRDAVTAAQALNQSGLTDNAIRDCLRQIGVTLRPGSGREGRRQRFIQDNPPEKMAAIKNQLAYNTLRLKTVAGESWLKEDDVLGLEAQMGTHAMRTITNLKALDYQETLRAFLFYPQVPAVASRLELPTSEVVSRLDYLCINAKTSLDSGRTRARLNYLCQYLDLAARLEAIEPPAWLQGTYKTYN